MLDRQIENWCNPYLQIISFFSMKNIQRIAGVGNLGIKPLQIFRFNNQLQYIFNMPSLHRKFTPLFISIILAQIVNNLSDCPLDDPLYGTYCSCDQQRFSLIGKCIYPKTPCDYSSLTEIYTDSQEFNQWDSLISKFWNDQFIQARKTTTPSAPLPTILNSFDFQSMTDGQKRGWVQAYYFYKSLQSYIQALFATQKSQLLFSSVDFIQASQQLNYIQIWSAANELANTKFKKTWTLEYFTNLIQSNSKSLMPCHICQQNLGPVLSSGNFICLLCPQNCKTCSKNAQQCNSCIEGFYLNAEGICQRCTVADCAKCGADGVCTACAVGKTLMGNSCKVCSDSCVLCEDSPSFCTQCNTLLAGEVANSAGGCVVCAQTQCHTCDPDDASICKICGAGYYPDSLSQCQKCPSNCIGCTKDGCYSCDYGYGIFNRTCQKCLASGCLTCNQKLSVCDSCLQPFFFLNSTTSLCQIASQQKKTRAGCLISYPSNECFSCQQHYYLSSSQCLKCSQGCLTCTSSTCLKCQPGYQLQQSTTNTCLPCPSRCKQCTNQAKECQICFQRYVLSGGVCVLTSNTGCMFFSQLDPTLCQMCKPGYSLLANGTCIRCLTGQIWSCNSQNISQYQKTRFQLNNWYFNQYNLGRQGCYTQVGNNCLQPDSRYNLTLYQQNSVAMYRCLFPCHSCNYSNIVQCYQCEKGYYLNAGKCLPNLQCKANCASCPLGSYRTGNGGCALCEVDNCESCDGEKCVECHQGYYLDQGVCKRCPDKCRTCYDGFNCNQCARGYVKPAQWTSLNGQGDCVVCNPNCLTCRFQESICTSCKDKMFIVDNKCVSPIRLKYVYTLNITPEQFMNKTKSQQLINDIASKLNISPDEIFLQNITENPAQQKVVIQGFISTAGEQDAKNKLKILQQKMPSNFKVQDSRFSILNANSDQQPNPSGPSQDQRRYYPPYWIWIVAGIILGLITIATIIWAIYRKRKRQREMEMEEKRKGESDNFKTEKYLNDYSEPVNKGEVI